VTVETDTAPRVKPAPGAELLVAKGVVMQFGGLLAVNNVDLTVREGEIVGLIGPNGAGKTTFFNCLTGMYRPTRGTVTFQGSVLPPRPRAVVRAGMARTFQNIRLFSNMSALENVMVGRYCRTSAMAFTAIVRGPKFRREEAATRERARRVGRAPGPQPALRRPAAAGDRPGAGHRPEGAAARRADGGNEPAGDPSGDGVDLPDSRQRDRRGRHRT
jgi:ABC-type sugar transport system ATPase subunit